MKKISLGRQGLSVSQIGLGCMVMSVAYGSSTALMLSVQHMNWESFFLIPLKYTAITNN